MAGDIGGNHAATREPHTLKRSSTDSWFCVGLSHWRFSGLEDVSIIQRLDCRSGGVVYAGGETI